MTSTPKQVVWYEEFNDTTELQEYLTAKINAGFYIDKIIKFENLLRFIIIGIPTSSS